MQGADGNTTQGTGDALTAAHRALTADPDIQFTMAPHAPPAPPRPPDWWVWLMEKLRPVGRLFAWLSDLMPEAQWARVVLWGLIVAAVVALLFVVVDRVRHGEWRLPGRKSRARQVAAEAIEAEWKPEAAPARAWLDEADALAARGLYAQAVHHLLFRSIEDLSRRRPALVRPSLTSRELAAATGIPMVARALFARIAGQVEASLFGGRAVGEPEWHGARTAYADFALPEQWQA